MWHSDENGFTLLETLVALAITSVLAIVLFQSTLQFVSISSRTDAWFKNFVDDYGESQAFQLTVANVVPDARFRFIGTKREFNSLGVPFGGAESLKTVELGAELDRQALWIVHGDQSRQQIATISDDDYFLYMGSDEVWRESWPPDQPLLFSPSDNPLRGDHLLAEVPIVPKAIWLIRKDSVDLFAILPNRDLSAPLGFDPTDGDY